MQYLICEVPSSVRNLIERKDADVLYCSSWSRYLNKAIAKVSTLPEAAQQKIGEELLLHVAKVNRLRAELTKACARLTMAKDKRSTLNV